jgi:hypothetical protein
LTCDVFDDGNWYVNDRMEYANKLSAILMGSTALTNLSVGGVSNDDVQMMRLVEYHVDNEIKDILLRSIPKFVHLRELCMKYDGNIAEFLDAIRKNGSLHRATCQELDDLAPKQLEKAEVYCNRNRLVPKLLAGPFTKGLSLCPRLFCRRPARRTRCPKQGCVGVLRPI